MKSINSNKNNRPQLLVTKESFREETTGLGGLSQYSLACAIYDAVLTFAGKYPSEYQWPAIIIKDGHFRYENDEQHTVPVAIDLESGIEMLTGYDLTAPELVETGWEFEDAMAISKNWHPGMIEELRERNYIA
jgi:hypothetical protein